jgi:hypothetical protein
MFRENWTKHQNAHTGVDSMMMHLPRWMHSMTNKDFYIIPMQETWLQSNLFPLLGTMYAVFLFQVQKATTWMSTFPTISWYGVKCMPLIPTVTSKSLTEKCANYCLARNKQLLGIAMLQVGLAQAWWSRINSIVTWFSFRLGQAPSLGSKSELSCCNCMDVIYWLEQISDLGSKLNTSAWVELKLDNH